MSTHERQREYLMRSRWSSRPQTVSKLGTHYLRTPSPRHRATATAASFLFVISTIALTHFQCSKRLASAHTDLLELACTSSVHERAHDRSILAVEYTRAAIPVTSASHRCDPCVDPFIALSSSREHLRDFVILYNDTSGLLICSLEVFCHIVNSHYSLWSRTTTPL